MLPDLARSLLGSSDIFEKRGRQSFASINFVTSHDGFTLNDLVSYDHKHNEANGEGNRDGHNANHSWNHGAEGACDDPLIQELRAQQQRNMLATLLFSQGTPMLLAGDEVGNSQGGNNNAYCQDNNVGWLASYQPESELGPEERMQLAFLRHLIAFRKRHPVLRRKRFLHGRDTSPAGIKDVTWLSPDGQEKPDHDWTNGWARSIGLMLAGDSELDRDQQGERLADDTLLIMLNAHHESVPFILPEMAGTNAMWRLEIDTGKPNLQSDTQPAIPGGTSHDVEGRRLLVWRLETSLNQS